MTTFSDAVGAVSSWVAKLSIMITHTSGHRYHRTRLASILVLIEPLGIIFLFSIPHYLSPITPPPFGRSFLLFFATGIVPYYLFMHVSGRVQNWDTIRRVPGLTDFDILLSQLISEMIMKISMVALLCTTLWLAGTPDSIPENPLNCMLALTCLAAFGVGVGLINAVIVSKFFVWNFIYGILVRVGLLLSGVLYVMDYAPISIRSAASFNPVAQGVTWYRSAHYYNYPAITLDLSYFFQCAFGVIVAGWLLEGLTRKAR